MGALHIQMFSLFILFIITHHCIILMSLSATAEQIIFHYTTTDYKENATFQPPVCFFFILLCHCSKISNSYRNTSLRLIKEMNEYSEGTCSRILHQTVWYLPMLSGHQRLLYWSIWTAGFSSFPMTYTGSISLIILQGRRLFSINPTATGPRSSISLTIWPLLNSNLRWITEYAKSEVKIKQGPCEPAVKRYQDMHWDEEKVKEAAEVGL